MKEELKYLKRRVIFQEDDIITLKFNKKDNARGIGAHKHYDGRIEHAEDNLKMLNSIIDFITLKELKQ